MSLEIKGLKLVAMEEFEIPCSNCLFKDVAMVVCDGVPCFSEERGDIVSKVVFVDYD